MQDSDAFWGEVRSAIVDTRSAIDAMAIPEAERVGWHVCLDKLLSAAFLLGPVLQGDAWILSMIVEPN